MKHKQLDHPQIVLNNLYKTYFITQSAYYHLFVKLRDVNILDPFFEHYKEILTQQ